MLTQQKLLFLFMAIVIFVFTGIAGAESQYDMMMKCVPDYMRNINFQPSNINVLDSFIFNENIEVDSITYISDNLKITGLVYKPVNGKISAGIVIAHGYYPVATYFQGQGTFETGIKLAKNGFVVIIPDYRGYNKSEGGNNYPYPGESVDVIIAAMNLKKQYNLQKIYLIGYSWGGGIAATAAEISRVFDKLILYYPQMGGVEINQREFVALKQQLGLTGKQIMDFFYAKSPIYGCGYINIPVMIFHGLLDKTVKAEQPEKLYALLKEKKKNVQMKMYEDYSHAFADDPNNKSWNELIKFLKGK